MIDGMGSKNTKNGLSMGFLVFAVFLTWCMPCLAGNSKIPCNAEGAGDGKPGATLLLQLPDGIYSQLNALVPKCAKENNFDNCDTQTIRLGTYFESYAKGQKMFKGDMALIPYFLLSKRKNRYFPKTVQLVKSVFEPGEIDKLIEEYNAVEQMQSGSKEKTKKLLDLWNKSDHKKAEDLRKKADSSSVEQGDFTERYKIAYEEGASIRRRQLKWIWLWNPSDNTSERYPFVIKDKAFDSLLDWSVDKKKEKIGAAVKHALKQYKALQELNAEYKKALDICGDHDASKNEAKSSSMESHLRAWQEKSTDLEKLNYINDKAEWNKKPATAKSHILDTSMQAANQILSLFADGGVRRDSLLKQFDQIDSWYDQLSGRKVVASVPVAAPPPQAAPVPSPSPSFQADGFPDLASKNQIHMVSVLYQGQREKVWLFKDKDNSEWIFLYGDRGWKRAPSNLDPIHISGNSGDSGQVFPTGGDYRKLAEKWANREQVSVAPVAAPVSSGLQIAVPPPASGPAEGQRTQAGDYADGSYSSWFEWRRSEEQRLLAEIPKNSNLKWRIIRREYRNVGNRMILSAYRFVIINEVRDPIHDKEYCTADNSKATLPLSSPNEKSIFSGRFFDHRCYKVPDGEYWKKMY